MGNKKESKKSSAEKAREYHMIHPEVGKLSSRKYYLGHKELMDTRVRRHIAKNRDRWNDCRRRKRLQKNEKEQTEVLIQASININPEKVTVEEMEKLKKTAEKLKDTKEKLTEYENWVDGRTLQGKALKAHKDNGEAADKQQNEPYMS